ncbi:MAG: hypothetical protein BZ136_07385 [Methanosphaera sp. rholeuAM74]|nr:MAG: hypothetical protein BZ136_07385 [Methanosphaera sp. rholeuAM74]
MPTDEYNEKQADEVLNGLIILKQCEDPHAVAYILGIEYRPYDPENMQLVPVMTIIHPIV